MSRRPARDRDLRHPGALRWSDLDPARHPFDPAGAGAVVAATAAARQVPALPRERTGDAWSRAQQLGEAWVGSMSRDLVRHYGTWVLGWSWSRGESTFDGGPVTAWCCPVHSIGSPGPTLARVAAALVEWRSYLEDLDVRFRRFLPLDPHATPDEVRDVWERAVAHLVTVVVERTDAESAWYGHCEQVLGWFLEAAGVPQEQRDALVSEAVGGRFTSWSTPDDATVAAVATRLAAGVAGLAGA